jgi:transcriptional regulator with XRE-family HTH domain
VPKQSKNGDSGLWKRFAESVMDLAKPKSLRQEDIAREIKVGQTAVSGYKTGDKEPSIGTAILLAGYAEMCVEFLLTGKGPQRPWGQMDTDFAKIVQAWEHLDDVNRAKLIERAEELYNLQASRRRPRWAHLPGLAPKPPKAPQH